MSNPNKCRYCYTAVTHTIEGLCFDCTHTVIRELTNERDIAMAAVVKIKRLESGLHAIQREFGYKLINNKTSTLHLFIDALIKGNTNLKITGNHHAT